MAPIPIKVLIWRTLNAADVRALLNRQTGHRVIVWGNDRLWQDQIGLNIKVDADGGTMLAIVADHPANGTTFNLSFYREIGVRAPEIRVRISSLLNAQSSVPSLAQQQQGVIDPDQGRTDSLVIFLVQTSDDRFHLRAMLKSQLPPPLAAWVGAKPTGGIKMTAGILFQSDLEQRVWRALMTHHNVLLYGPPGTGKTRLMLRMQEAFKQGLATVGFAPDNSAQPFATGIPAALPSNRLVLFTTFHQSLSYESFVIGLRPDPSGAAFQFSPKDGLFLELAAHAMQPDSAALLAIDEFNRGNVADIFGELITLLEPSKRKQPDGTLGPETVTVTLPLKPQHGVLTQEFALPHHLYMIASMNSLDRSVAPIDSAMRRRFRLIHIEPDLESVKKLFFPSGTLLDHVADASNPSQAEVRSIAYGLLEKLNRHIRSFWGPEFLLGQSYVLKVDNIDSLVDAWEESILPQLQELYRDHPQALTELLGTTANTGNDGLVRFPDSEHDNLLGGRSSAPPEIISLRGCPTAEVIRRLHWPAFRKPYMPPPATSPVVPGSPNIAPDTSLSTDPALTETSTVSELELANEEE